MDAYTVALILGATGLGAMALSGVGQHGHAAGGARGHSGGGHVPVAGHAHGLAHVTGGARGVLRAGVKSAATGARGGAARALLALTAPRVVFSVLLGLGATGVIARRPLGGGALLFAAALAGGILFERLVVTPIFNFALRFSSEPALTLESCITDEAEVVSSFDARGQGLVAVELDGQVVQLLGTLQPSDIAAGVRVRTGDRVRIEAVDAARNRCTVTRM